MMPFARIVPVYLLLLIAQLAFTVSLTLQAPHHIPALPPSTTAYLTALNSTLHTPITRANTFVFPDLTFINVAKDDAASVSATTGRSYLLDIACRDYDFAPYGVDVKSNGIVEIYRVGRGGIAVGEKVTVGDGPIELRVLKAREFYEKRGGFDPLAMLKSPMILIGIVGLAFVFGMPYLMDNMDPEMKKEFEEQQKKGILGTGGSSAANPITNFDMAAWMAGKTATPAASTRQDRGGDNGGGPRQRRRG